MDPNRPPENSGVALHGFQGGSVLRPTGYDSGLSPAGARPPATRAASPPGLSNQIPSPGQRTFAIRPAGPPLAGQLPPAAAGTYGATGGTAPVGPRGPPPGVGPPPGLGPPPTRGPRPVLPSPFNGPRAGPPGPPPIRALAQPFGSAPIAGAAPVQQVPQAATAADVQTLKNQGLQPVQPPNFPQPAVPLPQVPDYRMAPNGARSGPPSAGGPGSPSFASTLGPGPPSPGLSTRSQPPLANQGPLSILSGPAAPFTTSRSILPGQYGGPPPVAAPPFGAASQSLQQPPQSTMGPPRPSAFGTPQQGLQQEFYAPPLSAPAFGAPPQNSLPLNPLPPGQFAAVSAAPPSMGQPPIGGPGMGSSGHGIAPLAEDFESLSMNPVPGSLDVQLDPSSLPRPTTSPDDPRIYSEANASPRYVRLTCNTMPNSQSLRSRWQLPLGAVVHPLAEAPPGEEVPVVNFGHTGIVRCRRCRTYINPFVVFTDGGRRWACNVCGLANEVPGDYFSSLDSQGRRLDLSERPELCHGSVEYVASQEYMVRAPMPPVYFFLIDVSAGAAASGMLQVLADTVRACLDSLPGSSRTQVAFLTFDSTLHFYNLKATLTQPQMLVVPELEDLFLPLPDDMLVNLSESRSVVEALLDNLPAMFRGSPNIESALGPALKAAYMIMSQLGGKLLIFQSILPSLGVGRLKLRDDSRVYGTDREHLIRVTDEAFYKNMAADFSRAQISADVFAFAEQYTDLASLGTLAKYTGGQVYYYPGFNLARDGDKFSRELARDLTRETGWEAVMRIRCGKGLKISSFHGHFFVRSIDLLALPSVDCDKAYAVQISHEESLLTTPTVYLQTAVLYTCSAGERRIRVHTVAIPVVADLGEMYRTADCSTIATVLMKLALERSMSARLEDSRQLVQQKVTAGLREFRLLQGLHHRTAGRLIYPESLKLLPIYVLGMCKAPPIRGGRAHMSADARSAAAYETMSMSVARTLRLLYPLLLRIDNMPPECGKPDSSGNVKLPAALPLVAASLDPTGAYLLDDGLKMIIFLGGALPNSFVIELLGAEAAAFPDISQALWIPQQSEVSKRAAAVIDQLRRDSVLYQEVRLVRQGQASEQLLLACLVEDRGAGGVSYADFMVHLHRQALLKSG